MSVSFRWFVPEDLPRLALQPEQTRWMGAMAADDMTAAHGEELLAQGPAWTALGGEGAAAVVLCCAGFAEAAPPHAVAWALLADGIGPRMTAITRYARAGFDEYSGRRYRRIEAVVRLEFEAGIRWAYAMGMEMACTLRAWGPMSEDHVLFERLG